MNENLNNAENAPYFMLGVMRSYYLQHKKRFNLFIGLLVLLYVNLMLPVMVRRRDYPQSYIEWIV